MSAPRLMALGCLPCVRCVRMPRLSVGYSYWGYGISCPDCYDGAPDSSVRNEFADEPSAAQAVDSWNEIQREQLPVAEAEEPPTANIIDLFEALKRSLEKP